MYYKLVALLNCNSWAIVQSTNLHAGINWNNIVLLLYRKQENFHGKKLVVY